MKWLFFKSFDTYFFRDGKPFWRGDETKANLNFPPPPRTFYGALRTYIIMKHSDINSYKNSDIYKVVGDENNYGELEIIGPFIYDSFNDIIYFPKPKDLMKDKNDNIYILKPIDESNFKWNLNYNLKPVIPERINILEEIENKIFLKDIHLDYYLNEDTISLRNFLRGKENIYSYEYKVGIEIDKTSNTVLEGNLYSVNHIRFNENMGFLLGIENDNNLIIGSDILRLGGETRVSFFEDKTNKIKVKIDEIENIIKESINDKFKMILLTPAVFKNGWFPDFLNKNSSNELIGTLPETNINVKLVGCILGKPKNIGGFDLVKNHPKTMLKYVPEGSVYYFEILDLKENDKDKLINLNFKSILNDNNLKKEGFGKILIGGW